MAQPIQVSPIQVSSGDGLEYLGQSINALVKAKEAREKALRDAVLKQQENNYKIFGDSNELLRKYNDSASSMPIEQRDAIFSNGVKLLSQYANSPNYAQVANQIVAGAYQSYTGWNDYFKKSDEAAKDLSAKYGMDEKAIKAFAYKNIKDPVTGEVKSPTSFGDVYGLVSAEVIGHPELYVDQYKLTNGAYKDLDGITGKPQEKGDKLTLDPTGTTVKTIGTDYSVTLFDKENQVTDPVTGLKYSRPVLDEHPFTGGITAPNGSPYNVLSEEKFETLIGSQSPMIKQKLMIGAIDKIRDHNAEVFKRAGLKNPEELSLAVSKNNVSNFDKVKGFINPFDESNMDLFQRAYAADFLKGSGRYNPDGSVIGFKMDRGIRTDNPPKTESDKADEQYIKAYDDIKSITQADAKRGDEFTPLKDLPDYAQNVVISQAKSSIYNKINPSDIKLGMAGNGVYIVAANDIIDESGKKIFSKNDFVVQLTGRGVDVKANQPLGQKYKTAAAAGAEPVKKKYNPNTGKYE